MKSIGDKIRDLFPATQDRFGDAVREALARATLKEADNARLVRLVEAEDGA